MRVAISNLKPRRQTRHENLLTTDCQTRQPRRSARRQHNHSCRDKHGRDTRASSANSCPPPSAALKCTHSRQSHRRLQQWPSQHRPRYRVNDNRLLPGPLFRVYSTKVASQMVGNNIYPAALLPFTDTRRRTCLFECTCRTTRPYRRTGWHVWYTTRKRSVILKIHSRGPYILYLGFISAVDLSNERSIGLGSSTTV